MAKLKKKVRTSGSTRQAPKAKAKTTSKAKAKASPKKKPAVKKKPPNTKRTSTMKSIIANFPTDKSKVSERRPSNNPVIPMNFIADMVESFTSWRDDLEDFSAHLRALDRKRLNGVGIKKLGFIGRALQLAAENPEFLPHWLSLQKFQNDNNYFLALRSSYDVIVQVKEILWNIILEASDVIYTDALEYYSQVGDAAKRRIDPAETLYNDLKTHFKKMGSKNTEEPTEKKAKRDFNALLHGKKDGKIVVENIKPKITGGKHKVIDEEFKDNAQFKESESGEID